MKLSKMALSVLLALGVSPLASAADLLDIYHAAQSQDAVFASARASQQAGQEKLTQGRSLLLPSVNLNANSTYNDVNTQYTGAAAAIPISLRSPAFQQPRLRRNSGATAVPRAKLGGLHRIRIAGGANRSAVQTGRTGSDTARGANLFRCADRTGHRATDRGAENRHLRATGTSQTQLRSRHAPPSPTPTKHRPATT